MLSNIHFNSKFASNVKQLQLFYQLRFHAAANGGDISGFNFTKNQKYNQLPKLRSLGLVEGNNIVSYRKLCTINECVGVWADVSLNVVNDINLFKGWLIASFESSALRSKYRENKGISKVYSVRDKCFVKKDWLSSGKECIFYQTKKIDQGVYSGRVYNKSISRGMQLSGSSVSRWRKFSSNKYDLRSIESGVPYIGDRGESKMFRKKDLTYVTLDLVISSYINIFNIKKYNTHNLNAPQSCKPKQLSSFPELL